MFPNRVVDQFIAIDREWYSVPAGGVVAVGLALFAPLPDEMATMLAITVFSISLWITTPVPPWFTSLITIGLIGLSFSTSLAFSGFTSPAVWLIVFGIFIGEAVRASGLAERVDMWLLFRMPERLRDDGTQAYRFLLTVLCFSALGLAVVVPSALVRILILAPILRSIGELFSSRRARIGLFLGPLFATYYGGTGILTGSIVNIIVVGIVESMTGHSITWGGWLLWLFPLMGVGRTIVVLLVTYRLYRPGTSTAIEMPERTVTSITADERRMLLFLFVGVAVWATDFLHGLHPLYGALLVVVLSYAPTVGTVDLDVLADADLSIIFFIGAIFAIAEGLSRTGFTDVVARTILSHLSADTPLALVLVAVFFASAALVFLMEGLAVASVLTPVLVTFAGKAGLPILPIVMIEAVMLSTYFFPYQSAVLVAILSIGVVNSRELIRMTATTSLVSIVVLVPPQIALFVILF